MEPFVHIINRLRKVFRRTFFQYSFIQKILNNNRDVQALLLTDYLVLWSSGGYIEKVQYSLNRVLDGHLNWCMENNMIVNLNKMNYQLNNKTHEISLSYSSWN